MANDEKKVLRIILNGKKAGLPGVREAVQQLRAEGHRVDVRVTWEGGDAARLAAEALDDDVDVIVAGGGDGTVNEVVNGICSVPGKPEKAAGIMPLGSANDFARGCGLPVGDPAAALRFAATGQAHPIDIARVNNYHFVNAAVVGFGAEVTFRTSEKMKKVVKGAAYGITGFLLSLKMTVYRARVTDSSGTREDQTVFAAASNGIQAGGFRLAPRARLNDGLIDVLNVPDFSLDNLPQVHRDMQNMESQEPSFVRYRQLEWLEIEADQEVPFSPDGEELMLREFRIDMLKQHIPFVIPPGPLLGL